MAYLAHRVRESTPLLILTVVLLSIGTASAAKLITGKDVANHSLTGADIKAHSLPLSVLQTAPHGQAGPAGTPGARGDAGPKGEAGVQGLEGHAGPTGPAAITELVTLNSQIATEIASSAQFAFLGTPATLSLAEGDAGQVNASVTIGSTKGTINSRTDFQLTVCASIEGKPLEPLETEEEEKEGIIGISPTISQRTAIPVSSGFAVVGEFEAEIGPCFINATGIELNDNGRVFGDVIVAAG
ncbi:MAG: collagen-like protein [Solirubrobacterales bacterium]